MTQGTGTNTNVATQWSVPNETDDFSLENTMIANENLDGTSVEAGTWTGNTDFRFVTNLIPYSQTQNGTLGHVWGISTPIDGGLHAWMAETTSYNGNASFAQVQWSDGNFVTNYGSYIVNYPRLNHAQGEVVDDPRYSSAAWMGQGGNYPNGEQFLLYFATGTGAWTTWGEMINPCQDPGYWVYPVPGTVDEYRNGGWPATPPP